MDAFKSVNLLRSTSKGYNKKSITLFAENIILGTLKSI
jgi:hypothetical protein